MPSMITSNLREKFPHRSTYIVGVDSVDVYPSIHLGTDWAYSAIGTLAPGQSVFIDHVIILPEPLFPDWWVWGALNISGTPKYILMRKPVKNLFPKEYVFLNSSENFPDSDLLALKKLILESLRQVDHLIEKTPSNF